jgi:colanic acid/amylovoran biosynthesis glycosyltransferase
MRKVLIFKENLLPLSETFILAQTKALSRYTPIFAGLERAHPSLPLLQQPLLLSEGKPAVATVRAKVYRRMGSAPLFHARVKRSAPDLIHAHFASGGRSALPLARALGLPLIVTLHGSDVTVHGQQPDRYRRLQKEASLFICVSRSIRDHAIAAGFPVEKLTVHHIGIDRTVFKPQSFAQREQTILFVGRLVEKKGCEYLLRAMPHIQKAHPRSELNVIGDGPLRRQLEALSGELRIRCRFSGAQSSTAVHAALRTAKVFCVPSVTAANGDSEGLPTVFAEAQAMGVPVVSTTHGGIPEIILDGVNGLLVRERDYLSLGEAISGLLGDEAMWERFHQAAIGNAAQFFDLAIQTGLLEDIYSRVVTDSSIVMRKAG